jgi:hypothetical protein
VGKKREMTHTWRYATLEHSNGKKGAKVSSVKYNMVTYMYLYILYYTVQYIATMTGACVQSLQTTHLLRHLIM